MKVSVYDTYVTRKDGRTMHFDILVPESEDDQDKIYGFGRQYLSSKGEEGQPLTASECRFCHIESATQPIIDDINKQGFYIVEMENC